MTIPDDITFDSILESMTNARLANPTDVPDLIVITTSAAEKIRKVIPVVSDAIIDPTTIYGIPFESYPTLEQCHDRILDLQGKGKHIMLVSE